MRISWMLLFALLFSVPAQAAYEGPSQKKGGFQGPSATPVVSTVAQAQKAGDDTRCVLEGHIISQGPEHEVYQFKDETGTMAVEIDDDLFAGRTVTPQTLVRLHGEVDTKLVGDPEIDVDAFEIVK